MNVLGLIGIVLFYIAVLCVAILAARRKKDDDLSVNAANEFILAGRDFGVIVGALSLTATLISGIHINGIAEVIYTKGFTYAHTSWCYAASLIIGGIFFAKRMRDAGYITMLDPLQEKYGKLMGVVLYIPALLGEVCWIAAILASLGSTASIVLQVDIFYSVIASVCVVVTYIVIGGLHSVTFTDILQLFCMFTGLCLIIPFMMLNKHVDALSSTMSQWIGEIKTRQLGTWIDSALLVALGGIPWQVYFQRVLSSKTAHYAQIMSFSAATGCLVISVPAILIGAISKSTDWSSVIDVNSTSRFLRDGYIKDPKLVVPIVLHYLTPAWVSVVGLGVIAAAAMSSVDSLMLSASSMFGYNIYKLVFRHKASSRELIWVLRVTVIIIGVITTVIGLTVDCIYQLWIFSAELVYITLFPQLFCAIYVNFANIYGSIAAFTAGIVLRICGGEPLLGIPALIKYPLYNEVENLQYFPIRTFAMGSSLLVLIIVSFATNHLLKEDVLLSQDEIDIIRISYNKPVQDNTHTSFSKISRFSGSYNNITASATELRAREDKLLLKSSLGRSTPTRSTVLETDLH